VALSETRFVISAALFGLLQVPAVSAPALTIDFEALAHGEVVADQYQTDGVNFAFDNFNRSFDIGVAFDTGSTGNVDVDLEGPFSVGNLAGTDLGNILVLNQNRTGCTDGICDVPDDEGRRAAGTIALELGSLATDFGFDLIDVEDVTLENGSVAFFAGDSATPLLSVRFDEMFCPANQGPFCDASLVSGNHSANRIQPFGAAAIGGGFDRVLITLGGSGGVDNLLTTLSTEVPEPSALWLAAPAIGGLLTLARRRRT
jgi:hypothetical protein